MECRNLLRICGREGGGGRGTGTGTKKEKMRSGDASKCGIWDTGANIQLVLGGIYYIYTNEVLILPIESVNS